MRDSGSDPHVVLLSKGWDTTGQWIKSPGTKRSKGAVWPSPEMELPALTGDCSRRTEHEGPSVAVLSIPSAYRLPSFTSSLHLLFTKRSMCSSIAGSAKYGETIPSKKPILRKCESLPCVRVLPEPLTWWDALLVILLGMNPSSATFWLGDLG